MNTIRTVIETLIRLVQSEVLPEAVLVAPDDVFEVKRTPNLLLQGPTLHENAARRSMAPLIHKDVPSLSYEGKNWTIVKDGNKTKLQAQNSDGDMVPIPIMRVVLLNFNAERGRAYYEGTYNPAQASAPLCWSPDGKAPDPSVKAKQSSACNG